MTGSEFAHQCAYIWLTHSNKRLKVFVHRLSTYQWFHTTFCWKKYIIHESDVIWAPRRLKLPVTRLFVQSLFRLRWNKNKTTHYWPFWGESAGDRWIPGFQCGKRFHIMTSLCWDSFVLCDYDIDVVKAYQSGSYLKRYFLSSLMTSITNLNNTLTPWLKHRY